MHIHNHNLGEQSGPDQYPRSSFPLSLPSYCRPPSPQKTLFDFYHHRWFWMFSTFPKWNNTVCTLLHWTSFTQLYVFEVHQYTCVYYPLPKFYLVLKSYQTCFIFYFCSYICKLCRSYSYGGLFLLRFGMFSL